MGLIQMKNKSSNREKLKRIYINTLIPYFKFKNKNGSFITPKKCCIAL